MFSKATPYLKKGRPYDYMHTKILMGLCREIIIEEGLDEAVIVPAVIFHDIGWSLLSADVMSDFHSGGARAAHMKEGARLAERLLRELGYPKEKTDRIVHLVSVHDNQSAGVEKELSEKDELAVAGIDFLWRATAEGFKQGMAETGNSASEQATYLRMRAQGRSLSPAVQKTFEHLLEERVG